MDRSGRIVVPSLAEAVSLRHNLRALFVPPPSHVRPLDGLRALSILWVVLFHAGWYSLWYVPRATYAALLASPYALVLWRGDFGVDVFFVLSGFLIAGLLLDEERRRGRVHIPMFQLRRFLRTWPTLAVVVAIDVAIFHDNQDHAWLDLVYLSDFVPVALVCMGWTWSLSIEEQFYLLCPWILRASSSWSSRARVYALLGIAVALCGVSAFIVVRGGYHAFDVEIALNRTPDRWRRAFDALYTKPWMRAGALLCGVAAAVLHRTPGVLARLASARRGSAVAFVVAVVVAAGATHWPFAMGLPRWLEVAYMATYRFAFAAGVGYVLLFALSPHPLGSAVGKVLSHRALYPVGQLSYAAYLVNPIATTFVHATTSPWVRRTGTAPLLVFLPLDVVATFLAAAVLHLAIERPALRMRPKLVEEAPR